MPAALLKKFPPKAKRLWEATYRNSRSSGKDIVTSAKIAMGAVKKGFKKKKGVWVKKHLLVKLHLVKHGWIFPSYKFELELSNNKWDSEDQMVSENLLKKMVNKNLISGFGDVDHERYYKKFGRLGERDIVNSDKNTEGLYYLDSYKYENGSIQAIIGMNKKHSLFDKYLGLHQQGKFLYASAEFPNATIENGQIVEADEMLWSITDCPASDVSQGKMLAG